MTYLVLADSTFTLTLAMLLPAESLSLGTVVQIALLMFLSNEYQIMLPNCLYNITVVLLRLPAAPSLREYLGETIAGLHWSFVIYSLVLMIFWLAYKF